MDRTTRTIIVVGVAILVAAVASFGVYRAIQQMPVREVEVRSLYQVVAARPMPSGTLITKNDVKLVPWPAASPVPNGFKTIEQVVNRGTLSAVVANEPLTESKLAPLEAGAGLPPSITEGMRALSIRVNEIIGVAGFVVPGTHVDVLVTIGQGKDDSSALTRVVVSDVEVLTAGTRYDQAKSRDGQPIPTSVVTLLLQPTDAERVILAANQGGLMLTLRNPLDHKQTESKGVRRAALFGEAPPPPIIKTVEPGRRIAVPAPPPVPPPPPAPKPYTVETYKAAKRAQEVVKPQEPEKPQEVEK
jgi:pilus assembly protein CpaB